MRKIHTFILIILLLSIPSFGFAKSETTGKTISIAQQYHLTLKNVMDIQSKLEKIGFYKGKIDGIYGKQTKDAVIKFQKENKLHVDGIAGPETLSLLQSNKEVSKFELTKDIITKVQKELKNLGLYKGLIDGIYGKLTKEAVIKYQKIHKLNADGIVGPITLKLLKI